MMVADVHANDDEDADVSNPAITEHTALLPKQSSGTGSCTSSNTEKVFVTPPPPTFLDSPTASPLPVVKHNQSRPTRICSRIRRRAKRSLNRFAGHFWEDYSDWLEHAAFFLGTLCAVLAATMDLQDALAYYDGEDDDDGFDTGGNPLLVWDAAKGFAVASTTFYLLDTVLETNCFGRAMTVIPSSSSSSASSSLSSTKRRKRHFSNVPLLFGLGALFDLFTSLFEDDQSPWLGFVSEVFSVHFFFLCAVTTLARSSNTSHKRSSPCRNTLFAGDVLFLIGALLDLVASYGDHPTVADEEGRTQWICNAYLGLASSLTWMVDSLLYLAADILHEQLVEKNEQDDSSRQGYSSGQSQDGNSADDLNIKDEQQTMSCSSTAQQDANSSEYNEDDQGSLDVQMELTREDWRTT